MMDEYSRAESALRQEKNAIFSAWLIRRIGASGSLAGTLFGRMPLAMIIEPSDGSRVDAGAGAAGAGARVGRISGSTTSGGALERENGAAGGANFGSPVRATVTGSGGGGGGVMWAASGSTIGKSSASEASGAAISAATNSSTA